MFLLRLNYNYLYQQWISNNIFYISKIFWALHFLSFYWKQIELGITQQTEELRYNSLYKNNRLI